MSKFYSQMKGLQLTNERKPIEGLTKSNWNEALFLIRGRDEGIPAWHYILVPYHQINQLNNHQSGATINCQQFGTLIQYRDNQGIISPSSGWGIHPSPAFQRWIENQYGDRSFDEKTLFHYTKDDIRLCTMQRSRPDQLIGIYRYYNQRGKFHYLKLFNDYETTLAYRGGIRNYDRLIALNGINIEEETIEQITSRFENELNLPVEILVCSPATFHHYQAKNIKIHSNLSTVQHLKPVVHDQNPNQSNEIYQTGINKFKDSKDQSEHFQIDPFEILNNEEQMKRNILEDLPNELFYQLFDYFKLEDLHHTFHNQNSRLNNLLSSINNLSFIYDETCNQSVVKYYSNQIQHLTIDTSHSLDLQIFPHLNSLLILNRNMNEIQSKRLPHLKRLSFRLKFDWKYPNELIDRIFSNQFENLVYLNIGLIKRSSRDNWSKCPNLKEVSIHSDDLMIVEEILISCPNLIRLQIHFICQSSISKRNCSFNHHRLERFLLTSEGFEIEFDIMDYLFHWMGNLRYLYIQSKSRIAFIDLLKNIVHRLNNLKRFHCFIKEMLRKNERMECLNEIHRLSSCFQGIQCVKESEEFRIYSTD